MRVSLAALSLFILTLVIPPTLAQLYYAVTWLAPIPDSTYYRGDLLEIRIKLLEAGQPVSKASVKATLPDDIIWLSEIQPGIYEAKYRIGWDAPTGDWEIDVLAEKKVDNETYKGSSKIKISVKPTTLHVDIISPGPRIAKLTGEIKINLTYLDGSPVPVASVNATLGDKKIKLTYVGEGIYSAGFEVLEGRWTLRISASDDYANSGSASRIIYAEIKKKALTEIVREWLSDYWVAAAAGIGIFTSVTLLLAAHSSRRSMLGRLQAEKNRILELKKQAQREYFREKVMDRATYEKLMREYEKEGEKINEKIERIKKLKLRGLLYEKLKKK